MGWIMHRQIILINHLSSACVMDTETPEYNDQLWSKIIINFTEKRKMIHFMFSKITCIQVNASCIFTESFVTDYSTVKFTI